MQKSIPSLPRILVMVVFALSCFGLLLFLWLSFGGPVPLKPKGYRVQVNFPEATTLATEADVRVAGVPVGKVRKVEVGDGSVTVAREVDGGAETVKLKLPAVVTTDLRLNEPRYASLPNIMKAKSKPLANKTPADYGVDTAPRLTVLKVVEPPKRQAGIKVGSVDELIDKIRETGVIG